jgi:hypothetical protein
VRRAGRAVVVAAYVLGMLSWLAIALAVTFGGRVFPWEVWIWAVVSMANLTSAAASQRTCSRWQQMWDRHQAVFHGQRNVDADL